MNRLKNTFVFREAQIQDHLSIVEFQLEMAKETEGLILNRFTCEQGVKKFFDEPHRGQYYVAENDGRVMSSILIIPEWSDWRNGEVWWIHSVYVLPSARGNGLFTAFYQYIQELALAKKTTRGLRLYVDKTNKRAQSVYQKLGMNNHHYDLYEWMVP